MLLRLRLFTHANTTCKTTSQHVCYSYISFSPPFQTGKKASVFFVCVCVNGRHYLSYAAELDRWRLFRYARMLLATNATNATNTTPSAAEAAATPAGNTTAAAAPAGNTTAGGGNTTSGGNATAATAAAAPAAAATAAPAAAAPAAAGGLMDSPAAGAALGGGAASAVGGIVGKYKAKFEKIKEVKAKLMPKLEKSKELAMKIAKEVPKVAQAQAGKLQALQEDLQAQQANMTPPAEMKAGVVGPLRSFVFHSLSTWYRRIKLN